MASSRPWYLVIETLADLEQVDTSLIRDVIARVPDFWTDASDSVRERVALKYLEEYSCNGGADVGSAPGIDSARSSEEVLCSHMRKVMAPGSLERDGAKLSSHAIHQFILQKKASLPKSSLDLLKESILEGRCPSLKESSPVFTLSQVDNLQCNVGGESEQVNTLKFCTSSGQNHSGIQGSATLALDSGTMNLQEEPSESEKHLSEENDLDGDTRNHVNGNIVSTGGSDVQLLEKGSIHQLPGNDGCNGGEIQSPKQTGACSVSLQDPSASRQHLPERNASDCERRDNVELARQSSPPLLPRKESTCLRQTPQNGTRKNVIRPPSKTDHFAGELSIVPETPSDDSVSDDTSSNFDPNDEMLASEKKQLLSTQSQANPDSIACEWSEQGLCIKCDKGGQILSCSSRGCLIAVHESCLDPSVNFKGVGLFYCPFCSYANAAVAYCKARKTFFRAMKALSALIGRDFVWGHRKKLPPATIPGEIGVTENTDLQHSFHSPENQREKSNDNPLKEKEQPHGTGNADVCDEGNLPSRHPKRYDVSHNAAETDEEMVSAHKANTDVQHPNDAVNTMNTDKLPFGVRVTPPICEKADVTPVNRQDEVGNYCEFNGVEEHQHLGQADATTENVNLPNEGMDAYQFTCHDPSRAQQKDILCSNNERARVEKLKTQEQLGAAPDQDTRREASPSHPSERRAKRRYGAAIGESDHAQETVKNTKREKALSGSSSKCAVLEHQQVRATPDHGDDPEALNSARIERLAKRRRHVAAVGKMNDHQEALGKSKRGNSSSGSSGKHAAQPKQYLRTILGRRKKLFWSSEEEEILKEAVQKFGTESDGNYPWTKILEFGRHVFHRTRQPGDLKDKWRNIRKKEVKQEM